MSAVSGLIAPVHSLENFLSLLKGRPTNRVSLLRVLVLCRVFGCWVRRFTRGQFSSGRWAAFWGEKQGEGRNEGTGRGVKALRRVGEWWLK